MARCPLPSQTGAGVIDPGHFVYGSCDALSWVDYSLLLDASDSDYNFLIEVTDLSNGRSTSDDALSLHLFDGAEIPMDRFTEQRAERAVDGIYSVAINLHNFHEGASYFGIRCGAAARRFRVVVHRMDAIVPPDGGKHHGEVCPGVWVYHCYDVPATASCGGGVTFHVEKHEGDVDLVTRHGQAPVKLVPPFKYMGADEYEGSISLCNIKPGERLYLGMLGGDHCASYEVFATPLNAIAELAAVHDGCLA